MERGWQRKLEGGLCYVSFVGKSNDVRSNNRTEYVNNILFVG